MTFSGGYSSRIAVVKLPRITAKDWPSGAQSAEMTSLSISRGAPPARGTLAKVPDWEKALFCGFMLTAISPLEEMERISAGDRPTERESVLSKRVEKTSGGWPSQAAL